MVSSRMLSMIERRPRAPVLRAIALRDTDFSASSEKASFTYPTGCSGICGHYTQVVWRTSVNVGCALHDCPGLAYGSTIVCDYGPGGNSGGAPY